MINVYKTQSIKKFLEKENDQNPHYKKHGIQTRKHMVINGPSSSGKTNFLCNLLNMMTETFRHVYIFTAMTDEPIYQMLNEIENVHVMQLTDIIPHDELPDKVNNKLIVFDDFLTTSKKTMKIIETYAILSRKCGCSCLFLSQNYFSIPTTIRNQCAYIVLLKNANKKNLDLIIKQLALNITSQELSNIVEDATSEQFNVCIIDLNKRTIRKNFDQYYNIN